MDSGTTLRCSCHLARLSPSMSPPPLGERNRQFGRITSHVDSHTMRDHEDEIPKMSSPPHEVGDVDSTPVYDPSPKIPSHSSYHPSFTVLRYWLPGLLG